MGGAAACRLPVTVPAVASSGGGCGPSEREERSDLQSDRSSAQRRWGGAGRTDNIPPLLAPLRPWLWLLLTGPVRLSCPCEKAETAMIRAQSIIVPSKILKDITFGQIANLFSNLNSLNVYQLNVLLSKLKVVVIYLILSIK